MQNDEGRKKPENRMTKAERNPKYGARTFLSAAAAEPDAAHDTTGIVEHLKLAADRNVRAPAAVISFTRGGSSCAKGLFGIWFLGFFRSRLAGSFVISW